MRRRVSERASSSTYVGSRPPGPAGIAVPCELLVGGVGGGSGDPGASVGSAILSGALASGSALERRGVGRKTAPKKETTKKTAAPADIPPNPRFPPTPTI